MSAMPLQKVVDLQIPTSVIDNINVTSLHTLIDAHVVSGVVYQDSQSDEFYMLTPDCPNPMNDDIFVHYGNCFRLYIDVKGAVHETYHIATPDQFYAKRLLDLQIAGAPSIVILLLSARRQLNARLLEWINTDSKAFTLFHEVQ